MNKVLLSMLFVICFAMSGIASLSVTNTQKLHSEYKKTFNKYQKRINAGQKGYLLYLNAAGAAARIKKYGLSALYFSRALLVYDGDSTLKRNLSIVKARTGASRFEVDIHPLVKYMFFFYFMTSRATLVSFLLIGAVALLFACGFAFIMPLWKKRVFKISILLLGACLIVSGISFLVKNSLVYSQRRAVIVADKGAMLRSLEQLNSPTLTLLPPATEVSVQSSRDGNLRVVLPGGASGWIESQSVLYINR